MWTRSGRAVGEQWTARAPTSVTSVYITDSSDVDHSPDQTVLKQGNRIPFVIVHLNSICCLVGLIAEK
ncbi:hypothetical protein RRG08_044774 [Elysia crispata]|uniref:Uncharacterized protein n=1 Tax=Elysia crispata TaxID=231223 RepID=A0AAE0ZVA4_9GAST|nr:hypothetical protein RRG08_044774 [Elysia crispata]